MTATSPTPDTASLAARLSQGDRAVLARAITLVESTKTVHRKEARALIREVLPHTGRARRIGVTGVPGVGKSTAIDALGSHLTASGLKVAVLAVDPSSTRTGGSILGDKTRMGRLALDPAAYVRPSPTAGTLGGVAAKTREAMLLCEAAGFDVVLVETVGTGQSETAVADMTDLFVVLALPGAGDELQGIKKGVLEIADIIAVNKADGDSLPRARRAAAELKAALRILGQDRATPVLTMSGLTGDGVAELWETIDAGWRKAEADGELAARRARQQLSWMWALVEERLRHKLTSDPMLAARRSEIERAVRDGRLDATLAADDIAALLGL